MKNDTDTGKNREVEIEVGTQVLYNHFELRNKQE